MTDLLFSKWCVAFYLLLFFGTKIMNDKRTARQTEGETIVWKYQKWRMPFRLFILRPLGTPSMRKRPIRASNTAGVRFDAMVFVFSRPRLRRQRFGGACLLRSLAVSISSGQPTHASPAHTQWCRTGIHFAARRTSHATRHCRRFCENETMHFRRYSNFNKDACTNAATRRMRQLRKRINSFYMKAHTHIHILKWFRLAIPDDQTELNTSVASECYSGQWRRRLLLCFRL